MNTAIVYFLMLKPALIAGLLSAGLLVAVGAYLLPRINGRKGGESAPRKRLVHDDMAANIGVGP